MFSWDLISKSLPPRPPVEEVLRIEALEAQISSEMALSVSGISVCIGETVAIIGQNGAGKTCLLESLLGLRRCEARIVTALGRPIGDIEREASLRLKLGVQLQLGSFRRDSTVRDIVMLHRALYGPAKGVGRVLQVAEIIRKPYGYLSGGEKKRVDLYFANAHVPRLLILDEPSAGLDAAIAAEFRRYLQVVGPYMGMLLVTHDREDLERANRIVWLKAGRVAAYGTADELRVRYLGTHRLQLDLPGPEHVADWQDRLASNDGIKAYRDGMQITVFGPADVLRGLRDFGENSDVNSYAFSRTSAADLLWLASRGES
jgi:ABC-2 type transport system ATP-binding protein